MRHTDDEIEQAARRFDQLADDLDPDTVQSDNTEDLTQIAAASATVRADEDPLRLAVDAARAKGRSWNQIAIALGVSRQAARQRFTVKTSA
jgi:hypothetical protein